MSQAILFVDFFYADYWHLVHGVARKGFIPIVNTPALRDDLHRAGLPCLDWNAFTPADISSRVQQAGQRIGDQIPAVLQQPGALEAFASPFGNVLAQEGREILTKIINTVSQQVAVVETVARILSQCDVKMVVMRANLSGTQRAIYAYAEQQGVEVLEVAHGVIVRRHPETEVRNKKRLPGRYAAYGARDRRFLLDFGNAAEQLYTTGSVAWDTYYRPSARVPRADACRRLGLDPGRPVVLFAATFANVATPVYADELRSLQEMHRLVIAGVRRFGRDVQFVVRLHPGELRRHMPESRQVLIAAYTRWLEAQGIELALLDAGGDTLCTGKIDLIRAADVVVVAGAVSSVIPEIMILERPVVTVAWGAMQPSFGEDDGIHVAHDAAQLAALLGRLIDDDAFRTATLARQQAVLPDINHGHDGQAGARVAALIEALARTPALDGVTWTPPDDLPPLDEVHPPENVPADEAALRALVAGEVPARHAYAPLYSLLSGQRRYDEAEDVLAAAQAHQMPAPYPLLKAAGLSRLHQGRRQEALACWEEARLQQPYDVELLQVVGNLYLEEGRFKEAETRLWAAVRLNAEDADAWLAWAIACYHLGHHDAFRNGVKRVEALSPGHPLLAQLVPLQAVA